MKRIIIIKLLLVVAAFCFSQTDGNFTNLDVRNRSTFRGPHYIYDSTYFKPYSVNVPLLATGQPLGWFLTTTKGAEAKLVRVTIKNLADSLGPFMPQYWTYVDAATDTLYNNTPPEDSAGVVLFKHPTELLHRLTINGDLKVTGLDSASTSYGLYYDKATGIITYDSAGFPSGGGGLTDITYANLVTALEAGTLTAGSYYRITDFTTVHWFTDGTTTITTGADSINVGNLEPLIVFATSDTSIDSRVYSETYPQDVLHYDWNPDNWTQDISFADTGVIVTGWKGIITYRWDTRQDNSTGYDFRNVKFRRWAIDEAGSEFDDLYYSWSSTYCNGLGVDALDYEDFYTWQDYDPSRCFSNRIGINHIYHNPRLNNIVFHNDDQELCAYNSFNVGCSWMTFGTDCDYNTFGAYCVYNIFGASCSGNTFGAGCGSNTFGTGCNGNVFSTDCVGNTFGVACNNNTFDAYCNSNTFGVVAVFNELHIGVSSTDFTAEPLMTATYTKEIKICSDSTVLIEYIDCSGENPVVTLQEVTPPELP